MRGNKYLEISGTVVDDVDYSVKEQITEVSIPKGITEIGNMAFYRCMNLQIVKLPKSVTKIGYSAFGACSSIEEIVIPNSVTEIDDDAFSDCTSLKKIVIPKSVTRIGSGAFKNCTSLTEVSIPNSVIEFERSIFEGCVSLKIVNLPEGIKVVEDSIFKNCSSLVNIKIPNGVTEIGSWAFYDCSSLREINIPAGVTEIGSWAFEGCSSLTEINIPAGVTKLGWAAFKGCSQIKKVDIPQGVVELPPSLFESCSSLNSVTIHNNITRIADNVFDKCSGLVNIDIPNNVQYLGPGVFAYCTSLENVNIPDSITRISDFAFRGCTSLKKITIPNTVTEIGMVAFAECSTLEEINIPDGVTSIGSWAFAICSALSDLSIPDTVTRIGKYAFDETPWLANNSYELIINGILCRYLNKEATDYSFPETVKKISENAFSECASIETLTIPECVEEIENNAFEGCDSLKTIIVGKNTKIDAKALPENVKLKRSGVDKPKVEDVKAKLTESIQPSECVKEVSLTQMIIKKLSKIKFIDNILKEREKRLEQERLRREREAERERKRQEEERKLPGITRLKNYGFINLDPNLALTPLKVNQDRWFVNKIKPFEIINRYIQNDILILRCKLTGIPSELDLSIYKEGVVLQGTYILPFKSSTICKITRNYYNDKIYHYEEFPDDFITIYDEPWENQFCYGVEEYYDIYNGTKYTKDGRVDKRQSEKNRGLHVAYDRSYKRYKLSHTFTLSLKEDWEIYFKYAADVNSIYEFFKEVYNYTGRSLPPLEEFIVEYNKPTDHKVVAFLTPEEKEKCYDILQADLSTHGANAENVRKEKLIALLKTASQQRQKDLGIDYSDYIKDGKVKVGMRTFDCARAWGDPVSTSMSIHDQSTYINGVYKENIKKTEIWEYSGGRRLHFEKGILSKIDGK